MSWVKATIRAIYSQDGPYGAREVIRAVKSFFGGPILSRHKSSSIEEVVVCKDRFFNEKAEQKLQFVHSNSAVTERIRALESQLAQDQRGYTLMAEDRQVISVVPSPSAEYPDHPYVVHTVFGPARRVSVSRGLELGLLSSDYEGDQKIICGRPALISGEEVLELKLLQRVHQHALKAKLIKSSVSYEDGLVTVTRKGKSHSKGEATQRELWQERHTVSEDDGHERQHYLMQKARKQLVEVELFNAPMVGTQGHVYHDERPFSTVLREPCVDEADKTPEEPVKMENLCIAKDTYLTGYLEGLGEPSADTSMWWLHPQLFSDHEGYNGVKPLKKASRKENATLERERYRIGWDLSFAGKSQDGIFGIVTVPYTGKDDWKTPKVLGLKQSFVPKGKKKPGKKPGKKKAVRYWNKGLILPEFLELHNVVEKEGEDGEIYLTAGPLFLADGERDPERILSALNDETQKKGVVVKSGFNMELEAMLRGIVEGWHMESGRLVWKDRGLWHRRDRRRYGNDTLRMTCFTCVKRFGDDSERDWHSDVHADYCSVCGTHIWQVKAQLFASTKFLPFVNWTQLGYKAEYFMFEVYGDLVKEWVLKARGMPELKLKMPVPSVRFPDTLFGEDALCVGSSMPEWSLERIVLEKTDLLAFMNADESAHFGGLM